MNLRRGVVALAAWFIQFFPINLSLILMLLGGWLFIADPGDFGLWSAGLRLMIGGTIGICLWLHCWTWPTSLVKKLSRSGAERE